MIEEGREVRLTSEGGVISEASGSSSKSSFAESREQMRIKTHRTKSFITATSNKVDGRKIVKKEFLVKEETYASVLNAIPTTKGMTRYPRVTQTPIENRCLYMPKDRLEISN
jgi:hypothetical protein